MISRSRPRVLGQVFSERANAAFVSAGQTASETLLQLRTIAAFGLEVPSLTGIALATCPPAGCSLLLLCLLLTLAAAC